MCDAGLASMHSLKCRPEPSTAGVVKKINPRAIIIPEQVLHDRVRRVAVHVAGNNGYGVLKVVGSNKGIELARQRLDLVQAYFMVPGIARKRRVDVAAQDQPHLNER